MSGGRVVDGDIERARDGSRAWKSIFSTSPGARRAKASRSSFWRKTREGVEVKLLAQDDELYVYAQSDDRDKLRAARRREGRYLLRTNLTESDPALIWQYYIQLVPVEEGFKTLEGDLAIRPIFHRDERRIEGHIFVAFLAYCLQITLTRRLHGLSARSALAKFAAMRMIDVHLPPTDGRESILTRTTEPEPDLRLLIDRMNLGLPPQPAPKIAAAALPPTNAP